MQTLDITAVFGGIEDRAAKLKHAVQTGNTEAALAVLSQQFQDDVKLTSVLGDLGDDTLFIQMISDLALRGESNAPVSLVRLHELVSRHLLTRPAMVQRGEVTHADVLPASALSERQKRLFLETFAFRLLRDGIPDVPVETFNVVVDRIILSLINPPVNLSAQSVRHLFQEQIGILCEVPGERIAFASRHLQTFFAASAIIHEGVEHLLVENAHQLAWQEVVVLAVGQASARLCKDILTGILARGKAEAPYRETLFHLLARAYSVAIELDARLCREIERQLATME